MSIYDAMEEYMKKRGCKALHDPLAACVAVDPSICTFAQGTYLEALRLGSLLLTTVLII